MTGERATSCMSFVRSEAARRKFWELMKAGDVTDRPRRKDGKGKPTSEQKKVINKETDEAFEAYCNGERMVDICKRLGVSVNTLYRRFYRRNLVKPNKWERSK